MNLLWLNPYGLNKEIFFHRFDVAVHAEPLKVKNTLICQLRHVGRLRVNPVSNKLIATNAVFRNSYSISRNRYRFIEISYLQ